MRRLPGGCRSSGGRLAIAMERCRHSVVSTFNEHGYRLFWPSGLQLLETSWDLLPTEIREKLVVFNSHLGEPCCLRADITLAAVNYLSSHYAPQERPLRICYADRVYRKPDRQGGELEKFQIGAELLGWEGEGADAEMLWLLLCALNNVGLKDTLIVLSDATIVAEALRSLNPALAQALHGALKEGSYRTYETLLKNNETGDSTALLEALPELKGSSEVLDEVSRITGSVDDVKSLSYIHRALTSLGMGDRIRFDLGSVRELTYYSGPVFDVYSPKAGRSLGGGGRYDRLLSDYGLSGQGIGFGLDLEALARLSSFHNPEPIVAVWGGGSSPEKALFLCPEIQSQGMTTEIFWGADEESAKKRARAKGYRLWRDPETEGFIDLEDTECSQ